MNILDADFKIIDSIEPVRIKYPILSNPKETLSAFAEAVHLYLAPYKDDYPIIIYYVGTSGAILTLEVREVFKNNNYYDFAIVEISKYNNYSHKGELSKILGLKYFIGDRPTISLLIDDFVVSGETITRLCEIARNIDYNVYDFDNSYKILFTSGSIREKLCKDNCIDAHITIGNKEIFQLKYD